jgi:hypothetical protein
MRKVCIFLNCRTHRNYQWKVVEKMSCFFCFRVVNKINNRLRMSQLNLTRNAYQIYQSADCSPKVQHESSQY